MVQQCSQRYRIDPSIHRPKVFPSANISSFVSALTPVLTYAGSAMTKKAPKFSCVIVCYFSFTCLNPAATPCDPQLIICGGTGTTMWEKKNFRSIVVLHLTVIFLSTYISKMRH